MKMDIDIANNQYEVFILTFKKVIIHKYNINASIVSFRFFQIKR